MDDKEFSHMYTFEHGSYYWKDAHDNIIFMTDLVAVAYDPESFTLLRHGRPEHVLEYQRKHQKTLPIHVVTFPQGYDPEKLNRLVGTSGYMEFLLKELDGL